MIHVSNLLDAAPDKRVVRYLAQFLGGVARSADDTQLASAAAALSETSAGGAAIDTRLARVAGLVQERLHDRAVM